MTAGSRKGASRILAGFLLRLGIGNAFFLEFFAPMEIDFTFCQIRINEKEVGIEPAFFAYQCHSHARSINDFKNDPKGDKRHQTLPVEDLPGQNREKSGC